MGFRFRLFSALVVLASLSWTVCAGFTMTLSASPPIFYDSSQTRMDLRLLNSGDETAYTGSVQIVHPTSLSSEPAYFPRMEPGVAVTDSVTVEQDSLLPGTYALIQELQFHDSNNYPIYMVFDSAFYVDKRTSSKVYATLSSAQFPLSGSGVLTLTLKNADDVAHDVNAHVIVPSSLSMESPHVQATVPARSEKSMDFTVSNFMALPASDFNVYAVAEYEEGGLHYASLARGRVQLTSKSERSYTFLAVAAAIVVAAALIYYRSIR